jgi:hypothetical protein
MVSIALSVFVSFKKESSYSRELEMLDYHKCKFERFKFNIAAKIVKTNNFPVQQCLKDQQVIMNVY